jgi:hypothetical protein
VLIAADRVEPGLLSRLEASRYEDPATDFRFENSDLFGVGPLVDYLRDHPQGRQPRVVFLGNSVTYGYGLSAHEAVPAQFQRQLPSHKVYNLGVNGFEAGSAWLVAKASIAAVDEAYVLSRTDPVANPLMSRLIELSADDRTRFGLAEPQSALDRRLSAALGWWRLYRDSYRLQAALFGTSARQFIYLNKGQWGRGRPEPFHQQESGTVAVTAGVADAPMAEVSPSPARMEEIRLRAPVMLSAFADLFTRHRKSVVLLQLPGFADWLPEADVADFNRAWAPHARIVVLRFPPDSTLDGLHVDPQGARTVAAALAQERESYMDAVR